ncbi:YhgE/Pip domain-containing protein [Bacillus massiliglaciei]|uniref:YhgE/Pip domain-containing protein n=1 Tax=Bacillus massiliglaciei TaxID=1816693 RepID=UPI000A4AA8C7|nr:YhgE/Pip domain-containing protein [Bacillus massiliglaciei]
MKGIQLIFQDVKAMWHHSHGRIALIFLLLVPLIYSGFFLAGYWNPYGQLDKLPVAIVNLDQGAEMDGTPLTAGDDFVTELKKTKELDFHFVSASTAEKGLEKGDYYMVITVPKNFSKDVTTLMDKEPHPAKLLYEVNPGKNFVAAQISSTAVEKMSQKINDNITKSYSESVLDKFGEVSDGLADAGTGAKEIHQGSVDAKDGSKELTDGIHSLNEGIQELKGGSSKLADGEDKLADGASALTTGVHNLHTGLEKLNEGEQSLESGMSDFSQNMKTWSEGNKKLIKGQEQAADTADQLQKQLEQYMNDHPDIKDDQGFQQILALSNGLSQAESSLQTGERELGEGAEKLAAGQEKLQAGMQTFGTKLQEATAGADQLNKGASQFSAGFSQWQNGFSSLDGGLTSLADGGTKLEDGANDLTNGLASLASGSNELAVKLNDAAKETSLHYSDATTSMFSEPVQLVDSQLSDVPNYGTGIAPYFLSLAFYVGGIMASNILPLGRRQNMQVSGTVHFINKLGLVYLIGFVQALLVDAVVLLGFHLEVASVPVFILSSIIVSFTFMTLILMLVTVFGLVGKFAAVTLLVLQLASAGGTFPGELGISVLTHIGQYLPMTHSLRELQEVISLGGWHSLLTQIGILIIYLIASLVIGWIASHIQHAKVPEKKAA